ncbi:MULTISPECIES: DNA helicase PcrA [Paenarthrobacter]|uniref:ATP-dependent DNA helicase n=1 Tax=Paenarthrobacter ureafaciens TaxID=37931 RepID=A0AAX3EKJ4_PAEUR|nr:MULTISPECIES: DNA helicase PcrA [Paenarthrobacter]NKR11141.1 ATP-dependent DNA helicase PcrA [Arthrobacter sp. M5]NKR15287.1 ATP-dependent DNA helicase PcrA [Arthrobacter sp. M6]OEH59249.1 ATP-dependent DNA helicase PcrA [Arthrobacter sp. D4]OEH59408.1 ATP-dependent DNA helicase PcrA [Arthrobacter sp. D2]MDO5863654.1 DNA helicase PcrA [Paenarthrobacter sp. SD-2]
MDMLFDPYADGPFNAGPRAAVKAAPELSRPGGGAGGARVGTDNSGPGEAPGSGGWGHHDGGMPTADALLQGLNPQQEEAVRHAGSPLLIVAGAGSGKTRVLSNRIAYLIATKRAHHGEILAITFTNKAAAEMRERIEALVGGRAKAMWISTFHSSCVRILRREAANVGLNSNFSIYDSADSLRLITLVAKNLDLDPKKFPPKAIQHKISALKNELVDDDSFASSANYNDPFETAVAEVFKGYTQRLRQANAMDFDDLIAQTVYMFRAFPALAESYRRRFRHVLVDEYQDTNHAQYALVREIVGLGTDTDVAPSELTVVGDSDQSIYAFRGADIRNIVEFEHDYPNARTIKLEQNYRSTQNILSAANAVISRNPHRQEKRLWTAEGDGEKIIGYVGENEHDEAQFIAKEIDRLQDEEGLRPGDVAIFYRTNAQSRSIEDVLVRVGLPYKVVGGTRFYERKEIKDALAYLRVLVNPDDDVNLRRVLNEPKRGIGDRAEGAIAALAERDRTSFMDAARRADQAPGMATRSVNAVLGFVKLLDDLAEVATGSGASAALEAVLEQTGYLAGLRASNDPQDESRVENLAELVAVVREYERDNPEGTLGDFLEQVSLVADADQIPDAPGADIDAAVAEAKRLGVVTLMTLHTAKGLEFPVVFLTGMEHGIFPHQRSATDPKELAEERRLAYVGLTRARQRLYVTRSEVRSMWGQSQYNPASQFLQEIPSELVDWKREGTSRQVGGWGNAPIGSKQYGGSFWGAGGSRGASASPTAGFDADVPAAVARTRVQPQKEVISVAVGDKVNHTSFGNGVVLGVEGAGDKTVAKVKFDVGEKRLLLRYAPLTKLDA